MKIAKHICFYYQQDRLENLKIVIDSSKEYKYQTDVFIHTNVSAKGLAKEFSEYGIKSEGDNIKIISHDMAGEHGHFLAWRPRKLIKKQLVEDIYDVYMYVEDDIEVKSTAIEYWLDNYDNLRRENLNLGFMRIEKNHSTGKEYWLDTTKENVRNNIVESNLLKTDVFYYGFWIYCKQYTKKLIEITHQPAGGGMIREKAAVGLNGFILGHGEKVFEKTVIPIVNNKIDRRCKVRHLTNNYIGDSAFCFLEYDNVLQTCKHVVPE